MSPGDLIRSTQEGNLESVYLFQGNDNFLQKFLVEKISDAHFLEEPAVMSSLLPDEMKGQEILDRLSAIDLFAGKKLFILRKPAQIHSKWQNALINYCSNPVPGHILVIIEEDYGDKKAVIKKLKKVASQVSIQTPFESELKKWAAYFFKSYNLKVNGSVINAIMEIAGDSIHHLNNEIEKIAILYDKDSELTVTDVKQFSGWKREHRRWEFLIAVGNRNLKESLMFGSTLISQNDTLLQLIYPLTSLFTEIYITKINDGTSTQQRGYTFLTPGVLRRIPQFSKKYTISECERILFGLENLDKKLKSTIVHDDTEFANFIFRYISKDGK